jgi:ribose transport system permease protein
MRFGKRTAQDQPDRDPVADQSATAPDRAREATTGTTTTADRDTAAASAGADARDRADDTGPGGAAGADGTTVAAPERVLTFGDVFGRDAGGIVVLLVLFGALTLGSDQFLTGDNLANLARQVAIFGIIAVGQLLVILTAGIDLSVGSVLGLSGCVTAELLVHGVPIPLALLGGIAVAVLAGLINGALVSYANLPPFIVTLGMLGIARGVVLVFTNASTIQPLPDAFAAIANNSLLGVPNLLWIFAIVAVAAAFVLRRTVFGRYVYAIGSNPESARLAGVPVKRVLIAVYAIAGLLAGVGGALFTSRLNAGIPTAGTGYELNAIAACVIGGASLFGAKGGAFGAAAGALIVATLNNGGNLLAINSFYLQIIIGLLILVAVFFDQWQGRIAARRGR